MPQGLLTRPTAPTDRVAPRCPLPYSCRGSAMRKATGLRIIAGTFKGRRLAAPPGLATRPLPDRVKQALFDWLGQRMDGLHVADCCAGSGAFAFEALSRGARR